MSQQPVIIGTNPNDGTGDTLRSAFTKINANDVDLDTRLSALAQLVASSAVVAAITPGRIVTGSAPVHTVAVDYLVILNGPTSVVLESPPANQTTHVIKDRGSLNGSNSITITSAGSDLIDGVPSLTFTNIGQAATLTFLTGYGWSVY